MNYTVILFNSAYKKVQFVTNTVDVNIICIGVCHFLTRQCCVYAKMNGHKIPNNKANELTHIHTYTNIYIRMTNIHTHSL